MTRRDNLNNSYFEWLYSLVCAGKPYFRKLLRHLHNIEFRYLLEMDENRAADGVALRYRYVYETHNPCGDHGPCSVLEMLVAMVLRCEEQIMDDPAIGNRTGQWFWTMMINLGLGPMVDDRYDPRYVDEVINRLLNREYGPTGEGGLFTIRNPRRDLRDVEFWHQLLWYLDTIADTDI